MPEETVFFWIHWRGQVHSYNSRRVARKTQWWWLECGSESNFIRFMDRIHEVHFVEKSQRSLCGLERDWQNSSNYQTWECVAWSLDQNWKSRSKKREEQEWANEKPKLDNARRFRGIHFIDSYDGEVFRNAQYCEENVGTSNRCGNAVQERYNEALQFSRHWSEETWIQKKKKKDSKDKASMCRGGSRVHETTDRIMSIEGKG